MFQLNPQAARDGSGSAGAFIQQTGAYIGTIVAATQYKAPSGAEMMNISFQANSGEKAPYLSICYKKKDGSDNEIGVNQINALMACMKVRNTAPVNGSINAWDKNAGKEMPQQAIIFPELMDKPVGLFLQRELSTYNGEDKEKVVFYAPFNADTQQTAQEVLDQSEAKSIERMKETVKDYDKRQKGGYSTQSESAEQFEDDVPF